MTNAELFRRAWDVDAFTIAMCAAATIAYGVAHRGRVARRAWLFAAAIAVLFLALASPIAVLARGYLFSAHMLQHLLLLLVVPPLALLGVVVKDGPARSPRVLVPWLLGAGAMWIWHAPVMCNAAAQFAIVQRAQALSLLAMGTVFWWPVVAPRESARLAPFPAMVYLFSSCAACTVLGIAVTFSPVEVCSAYAQPVSSPLASLAGAPIDALAVRSLVRDAWGMTPRNDQEMGGLMMWVPACLVYTVAILATLARYYREPADAPSHAPRVPAHAKGAS
jgi:cytochrome c oxidase assembly factor CtaG